MKSYIQSVINRIEHNISQKINIEQLAAACFISPRQLYRDFYAYTGHSVQAYIRKRRLSKALGMLKYSGMAISDIAYLCGYSSQQALSKSVKNITTMTPKQYRSGERAFYFNVYANKELKQVTVSSQTLPEMLGIRFYYHKLNGIEEEAVRFLFQLLPGYSGRLFGRDGKQKGIKFCYELLIEAGEEEEEILRTHDIDFYTIQGCSSLFAQTSVKNDEEAISRTWNYFYNQWLQYSMFEIAENRYFEEYLILDNKIKKLVLFIEVRQKETLYKISFHNFGERLFLISKAKGRSAENLAANRLTAFLSEYHPHLYTTQKEFFIQKSGTEYTFGINLDHSLHLPRSNVAHFQAPAGLYAVLEGPCSDMCEGYEQILINWLNENGFVSDQVPFSLYDAADGADPTEIVVKSQVKMAE